MLSNFVSYNILTYAILFVYILFQCNIILIQVQLKHTSKYFDMFACVKYKKYINSQKEI